MPSLVATNPTLDGSLQPLAGALIALAGLAAVLFISLGGLDYLTSRGQPAKLVRAKTTIVRAASGLVLVLAAGWLAGWLLASYQPPPPAASWPATSLPAAPSAESSLAGQIIDGLAGVGRHLVASLGQPVIDLLAGLTGQTPPLRQNPVVGRLWLAVLGLANSLFGLVVILLGLGVIAGPVLGWGEGSLRTWLPRLGLAFLAMNLSLVLAETVIGLSNSLIRAFRAAVPTTDLWAGLSALAASADGAGLAGLLLLGLVILLALALAVYYLMRLIQIYLGAILAPLVILAGLLPPLRGFAAAAARAWLSTVFVLFIHVVLLALGASLFSLLPAGGGLADLLTAAALLLVLLKTPRVMGQLGAAGLSAKSLARLADQLAAGLGQLAGQVRGLRQNYNAGRGRIG